MEYKRKEGEFWRDRFRIPTGDADLADFDDFVGTLESMRFAEGTAIKQAALNRYNG